MVRALVACSAVALALSACSQQRIAEHLDAYRGQPVGSLFARLDYPDRLTTIGGQKAYVWGSDRAADATIFTATNGAGLLRQGPVTLTTSAVSMGANDHACQIRVIVDHRERIVAWDQRGNEGGCATYARRLARSSGA